jgi:pyrroline-5-carboxylate reductase
MYIGFLGTGNMGGAIINGYAKQARANGETLLAFDLNTEKLHHWLIRQVFMYAKARRTWSPGPMWWSWD